MAKIEDICRDYVCAHCEGNDLRRREMKDSLEYHRKRLEAIDEELRIQRQRLDTLEKNAPDGRIMNSAFETLEAQVHELVERAKLDDVVRRRNAKPQPAPELKVGWWYKNPIDGTPIQYLGDTPTENGMPCNFRSVINNISLHFGIKSRHFRPATLDDLAHDVDGVKVWMIKSDTILRIHIEDGESDDGHFPPVFLCVAREYARLAKICVICEAQWKELTSEE